MTKTNIVSMDAYGVVDISRGADDVMILATEVLSIIGGGALDLSCKGNTACGGSVDIACIDTNGICAAGGSAQVDGACVNAICGPN